MNPPRLIDGTLAACWRHTTHPLDRDAVATLTHVLPVKAPGVGATVPLVAPGAYGHDALQTAARQAHIVEPVDHAALASVATLAPDTIVVDPRPIPLGDLLGDLLGDPAPGANGHAASCHAWERRIVLRPHPAGQLVEDIRHALQAQPHRLRLDDPDGALDLSLAAELARIPDAHRLTIAPSNVNGIATATAHTMLAVPDGPAVIATLLGRAPRGAPATEHLADPHVRDTLRHAAETLALVTGRSIEPEHPHWGTDTAMGRRRHHGTNGDTLDAWVHEHLTDWGITLTTTEHDHLMTTLRARIRPGDHLDGPILWATLATVTDLPSRAATHDRGTA